MNSVKKAVEYLAAGGVVYCAMAACSAPTVGRAGNRQASTFGQGGALASVMGLGGTQGLERSQGGAYSQELGGAQAMAGALGQGGAIDTPQGGQAGAQAQSAGGATTQGQGGSGWSPVPDANAETSGTRLKAIYYVGADGSRQFSHWHDTGLDVDCVFMRDGAGVIRCAPTFLASSVAYIAGYVDSLCTQPYFDSDCATVVYGYSPTTDTAACALGGVEYYKLRPAQAGTQYFSKGVGTCIPKTPTARLHYVGDLQPVGVFVTAVETAQ